MVTIKEAVTKKDLVKFMEFPLELYKGNPYYVPDILASQVADMQKDKNPAFAFCQAKAFLAYRDGKIVGRISAERGAGSPAGSRLWMTRTSAAQSMRGSSWNA